MMIDNPNALAGRPLRKTLMHLLRRTHMYMGLLLFPWALLYGVSGYLFNHPNSFADQPAVTFSNGDLVNAAPATAAERKAMAEKVVAELAKRNATGGYQLAAGEIGYNRDFAFGTAKSGDQAVSFLYDAYSGGGTVRVAGPPKEPKPKSKAPFSVGPQGFAGKGGPRGGGSGPRPLEDGVFLDEPLHEKLKAAVPTLLEKLGYPSTDIVVTSVPDLAFPMTDAEGVTWKVTWNAMTGAVGGSRWDEEEKAEMSIRRFLLRLHTAHGYPGQMNAKWYWAVIVDAISIVLVFWGVSGLCMWWQIRRTRHWGILAMILSAGFAAWLAMGMHTLLTQNG